MRIVSGADGCRAGWVVISKDLDTGDISWHFCEKANWMINGKHPPIILTIDIPIGLPTTGSRLCDVQARHLLGPGRGSSVFPAPIRPVLKAETYMEACNIRFQTEGKKMSVQAWAIIPKIREVDDIVSQYPDIQNLQ